MKRQILGAAALLLTSTTGAVAAPVPASPAAQSFRIGAVEVVALRDAGNVVPNDGSVFGKNVGADAVAAVLKAAGAPTDALTLDVDVLLVKLPGHIVLIDSGFGPKAGGVLPQSLRAAGISPGDVTDIFITHSHGDHVGGLLSADGGLAFVNATIRMSAPEWAGMRAQPKSRSTAAAIAAKVQTFRPGAEVLPGIRAIALPGHTPGHSGYEITSGTKRLIDLGDTAHSAVVSLAQPGWVIGYDMDSAKGIATRRAELAKLAKSREPVFAPHFPFPGIGTIVARGTGYAWKPGLP